MLITLPNAFADAATNMAIDAALLGSLSAGLAAFRHYGWTEPAATFGYAQAYASVASELASGPQLPDLAQDRPGPMSTSTRARAPKGHFRGSDVTIIRRLTGGGIVDHRNDWTYALLLQHALPAASIPATELYERLHLTISQTLDAMGIATRLAPCPKLCETRIHEDPPKLEDRQSRHPASQCFVTPAANDVLRSDGRKIAGAAMKRSRGGLLIEGSLDRGALPEDFKFGTFQAQWVQALASTLALPTGTLEDIRPLFQSDRIEREKQRFLSTEWNQRR